MWAKDLSKTYKMGEVTVNALQQASFELYEGELIVVLGPSGSGKSTLLNIIGGMIIGTFQLQLGSIGEVAATFTLLTVGDGLYSAKIYNRLDLNWYVFRVSNVKALVQFSMHFLPDVFDMSQKFTVYLDLNRRWNAKT